MPTKLKRKKVEGKTSKDQVLLFHAMYVMAAVDGNVSTEEATVLRSILATLPDFGTADLDSLVRQSGELAKKYGGILESLEAFTEMSSVLDLRLRAFLLAVEVACASEGLNPAEDQLLSSLGKILGLADDICEDILSVIALKYA